MEEELIRRQKLERLRETGVDPYPADSDREATCLEAVSRFDEWSSAGKSVRLAGRLKSIRAHGGAAFADLTDETGKIQLHFKSDTLGEDSFKTFFELIDHGDFVQAEGALFTTKRGEKTLEVKGWKLLAKALLPMPEKWHGLSDVEVRYRQRYLDLMVNEDVRGIFRKRALALQAIRAFLTREKFIEVETPVLQSIPGGATAKPFITHHNALDIDLYLRIAPELYLKRLVVGGLERVFEVARCFRNEGIDPMHNPEFTQVEAYQAYEDYRGLMNTVERMMGEIAAYVNGKAEFNYQGNVINLTGPFPRVTFRDLIKKHGGIDIEDYPDRDGLAKAAAKAGVKVEPSDDRGRLMDELYKKVARPHVVEPIFMINHPVELSPLAKKMPGNPKYTERFQLVLAGGNELVNGFSELNDPLDQEARFMDQQKLRESGDEEAQRMDDDYVTALKHGMPPTAGFGIGIDRLCALLTDNRNIKETILFPTLRPE
jgi:lysyl-tRNA synthetase class 2